MAAVLAAAAAAASAADLSREAYAGVPDWENPYVFERGRLASRAVLVPCESERAALDIASLEKPRTSSAYVMSLDGTWKFHFVKTPDARPADFMKPGFDAAGWTDIAVPGCWQLQGLYDPALYVNVKYPHARNPPFIMQDPPKWFSSFEYRNPVGSYRRKFTVPAAWKGRRTVLHFGGVYSGMYVYVNGEKVGYSEDSRLPAEFDITPYLKDGENVLAVEVYRFTDGSYLEDQDFWRFAGIYRNVWLQSEAKGGVEDVVVSTRLSPDFRSAELEVSVLPAGAPAKFSLYDAKGSLVAKGASPLKVDSPALWSCEEPNLYTLVVESAGDWRAQRVGFRDVRIEGAVFKVNGRRVLFKGTDRHEMSPVNGYTVTKEEMQRDIDVMKSFNVNAVRTSHYPNDPLWYDLCDQNGIWVICEANIESHGMGYGADTLAKRPDFLDAHVARGVNMVKVFRNHASIVGWSLGNEAGDGPNFKAEYDAIKALDQSRPVQYEGAQDSDHSDVKCPMYAKPWNVENYVKGNPNKPYILCEYTHAMGNSNGSIQDYWDIVAKYPSAQGGFIWDFVDQAVWSRAAVNRRHGAGGRDMSGKAWLAYGGDFGDAPNDDNFNCNGFIDALRNPHPGAYEIKHAYRNIHVDSFADGVAKVRNGFVFRRADGITGVWSFAADGMELARGTFSLDGLEAGAVKDVPVKAPVAAGECFVTFRFFEKGAEIACDQFAAGGAFSPAPLKSGSSKFVTSDIRPNFWRAPVDNDRGNNMPNRLSVWRKATEGELPAGCTADVKREKLPNGGECVTFGFHAAEKLPDIPRVGVTFTIPKDFTRVTWYGRGPHENYSDRRTGAMVGVYSATVDLVTGVADEKELSIAYPEDRLNPDNYIEPGEQGYRSDVRWVEFSNGKDRLRISSAQPFGFNAWTYTQKKLEKARHQWDLEPDDFITVNIDAVQMGVGGDDSWGAQPHDPYRPKSGRDYSLSFNIE